MPDKPDKPTRKELIELLDNEIKRMEELPPMAMYTSVTHYDLYSFMVLVSGILRSEGD